MQNRILVAFVVALLLISPGGTLGKTRAHTVGIRVGDVVSYSVRYDVVHQGYPHNDTSSYTTKFTIHVLNISTAGRVGIAGYSLLITSRNGTVDTTTETATKNQSTIFDPSDNESYIGTSFVPFVYTDLGNQTNELVPLSIKPNSSFPSPRPILINSTVVSNPRNIYISVVIPLIANSTTARSYWFLKYNATNGLLQSSSILISQFGTARNFYYTLLGYSYEPPPVATADRTLDYVLIAAAIALVAGGVFMARRSSARKRREARLRDKFKRR